MSIKNERKSDSWKYKDMTNYELNQVITDYGFDAHQKKMAKRELNKREKEKKLVKV